MSKYYNKRVKVDGMEFDSIKEAGRHRELKLLEKSGGISKLLRQVTFELLPKNGSERAIKYIADFVHEENGKTVVEDVKGYRTEVYKIKRKLFKWRYRDIEFRES